MMKYLFIPIFIFVFQVGFGQIIKTSSLAPDSTNYENIYVKKLYTDSLSSTFAIWVKNEVKAHKHLDHSEVVTVISGKATMWVGSDSSIIKKGDVILIPKGTPHSVVTLGIKPLLVISVQAPQFLGKDRVWIKD